MQVSTSMLPEQERIRRHIPSEIVEEILLNVPHTSLLRFSTVSKSWNSMICESRFVRRHKNRATLLRRQKIIIYRSSPPSSSGTASYAPSLSSLLSTQTMGDSEPLIFRFKNEKIPNWTQFEIVAQCDEMLCILHEGSLFLWNPSIRTYRKLPHTSPRFQLARFQLGLGFDSSNDDYKILKINRFSDSQFDELYSLRSDSWKKIQSFPPNYCSNYCSNWKKARRKLRKGIFCKGILSKAGGAFYCMVYRFKLSLHVIISIISFDLSTEMYAVTAPPPCSPEPTIYDRVTLTVLRENLCVYVNYNSSKFVLWVMEEYGIEKSWAKVFEIDYNKILPYTPWSYEEGGEVEENIQIKSVNPLSFDDNGEIFISVQNEQDLHIIMHIDEESIPQTVFRCCSSERICEHPYVESLASPETY